MNNLYRALIFDGQVSLTLADTTAIVQTGIDLHKLSPLSAYVYGKAMSALAFLSGGLKEAQGEVSLSLRSDGGLVDIGASGNRELRLRGYIGNTELTGVLSEENERLALGENGAFTVVRDDGYNRPFVGACAIPSEGGMDEVIEEYYRISEQLPTRVKTEVEIGEGGECLFAGVAAVQPLPFASEETLEKVRALDLSALLALVKKAGVEQAAKQAFPKLSVGEGREAVYKCNCSREYLAGVLVTLGEAQLRDIIRTEGAVRVHCHYCNTDYEFTGEDADKLFPAK